MSKYRNIKVHVPTPEISEAVQVELAKHGCKRQGNKEIPANTGSTYIYVSTSGTLSYALSNVVYHFMNDEQVVPYQSILDPLYDVKIAWANGEVVQFEANNEWHDWESASGLITNHYKKWRIKPKTKTIKQWERKYLQGDIVMTMVVSGPDDSNNMECWIGEAYEAEYEVPND